MYVLNLVYFIKPVYDTRLIANFFNPLPGISVTPWSSGTSGSTTNKSSGQLEDDESFVNFLHGLLEVGDDVPGRPDKVGIALTRHLNLDAAYEKLAKMRWQRTRGEFKVPEGISNIIYCISKNQPSLILWVLEGTSPNIISNYTWQKCQQQCAAL